MLPLPVYENDVNMAVIAFVHCCIPALESMFNTGKRPDPELSLADTPESSCSARSFQKVNSLCQSGLYSRGAGWRPIKYTKYTCLNGESEMKPCKNPFQALPGCSSLGGRPCHNFR